MTRDTGRRPRRSSGDTPMAALGGVRTRALAPRVEPLEERQLLSAFYTGLSTTRPVQSSAGVFTLAINGPGLERITHVGKGQIAITLLGTTAASTLNVSLTRQKLHAAVAPVQIASIKVVSGQLGGINAGAAVLNGALTPLSGSVANIQFGGLGQNAQIDVNGSLNNLALGSVALGPGGHVRIAGDLNQTLSVGGPLILDGGSFVVGHNLTGALNVGGLDLTHGGAFIVGHDLTGGATVNGNLSITHGGVLGIGHNLGGLTVVQGATIDTSGLINVGNDLAGAFTVGEGLTVAGGGVINVTRDATLDKAGNGGIAIAGDLNLAGGKIQFGRDLDIFKFSGSPSNTASLNINGNLIVGTGGSINVGGNLNRMNVGGFFKGNGTATPDLIVGLSLANLVVNGGANNQGGIQQASIEVGKSLLNLTVPHGIFNSFITAGVLIDNVNVGPDGPDAVFNSDIRAGVRIDHTTIPGNVRSTFVGNPNSTGYPTRIVAGEDRAGNYSAGGVIDHFQITGELIDSVIAASVAPSGGKGMLPVVGYGQPNAPDGAPGDLGFNTYDAPAGTTTVFLSSNPPPTVFNNFTELSYVNGKLVGVAYASSSVDPTIDDFIYPGGSINPSFAVAGVLPSESTVLGGVISTKHGDPPDSADFAGLFAADTRGVFVGVLPS